MGLYGQIMQSVDRDNPQFLQIIAKEIGRDDRPLDVGGDRLTDLNIRQCSGILSEQPQLLLGCQIEQGRGDRCGLLRIAIGEDQRTSPFRGGPNCVGCDFVPKIFRGGSHHAIKIVVGRTAEHQIQPAIGRRLRLCRSRKNRGSDGHRTEDGQVIHGGFLTELNWGQGHYSGLRTMELRRARRALHILNTQYSTFLKSEYPFKIS